MSSFKIRPCTLDDEPSAIAVCLHTGDAGNDASLRYKDPNVLGYRYASPYIHLSLELAFVLEDADGHVCGYVLAALQSDIFYKRYVNEWLPKMRQLYPIIPTGDHWSEDIDKYWFSCCLLLSGEERAMDDWHVIQDFHHDDLDSFRLFDEYPSHLHIDLLPKAQGRKIDLDQSATRCHIVSRTRQWDTDDSSHWKRTQTAWLTRGSSRSVDQWLFFFVVNDLSARDGIQQYQSVAFLQETWLWDSDRRGQHIVARQKINLEYATVTDDLAWGRKTDCLLCLRVKSILLFEKV